MIAPWTALWERNVFAIWLPWLGNAMSSRHVQGAVTGVGLITVLAGLRDLTGAFFSRSTAAPSPRTRTRTPPPPPAAEPAKPPVRPVPMQDTTKTRQLIQPPKPAG